MTDFALEQKLQLAEKTIEQLRRENERLKNDVHSCGLDCTKAGCVNRQLREENAAQALVIEKLREFSLDQWWYKELTDALNLPGVTDDFKRAVVGVIPNLIQQIHSTPDYTKLLAERDAALREKTFAAAIQACWVLAASLKSTGEGGNSPMYDHMSDGAIQCCDEIRELAAKIRAGEEV
jgi:uncharacterized protein (DUF1778 family)